MLFYVVVAFVLITSTQQFRVRAAGLDLRAGAARARLRPYRPQRRARSAPGLRHRRPIALSSCGSIFAMPLLSPGPEPCAPGRVSRPRSRCSTISSTGIGRRPRRWPTGARRTASPDRAIAPPSATLVLRRAAPALVASPRDGSDTPRALALGAARVRWAMTPDDVSAAADGSRARARAADRRREAGLAGAIPTDAPAHVAGDIPNG